MRRLLKEPLLHFLVAGALLFAVHAWMNPPASGARDDAARVVAIGEGEVKWLVETWTRQWRRAPTQEELRGLVHGLLKEEILAREAREMGLDQGDTVVRRRLAQKLEFVLQDTAQPPDPDDAQLRRFHEAELAQFRRPARVSFMHYLFSREQRADAAGDATAALARLNRTPHGELRELGDRSLVEGSFDDVDERSIAALLGPSFARAVLALEPGRWHGPLDSGQGVHLVKVTQIVAPQVMSFEESRGQVLDLWRERARREAEAQRLAEVMDRYEIVVDPGVQPLIGPQPIKLTRSER
jgi:hypothetical protein